MKPTAIQVLTSTVIAEGTTYGEIILTKEEETRHVVKIKIAYFYKTAFFVITHPFDENEMLVPELFLHPEDALSAAFKALQSTEGLIH
jgi:hypothetical protein